MKPELFYKSFLIVLLFIGLIWSKSNYSKFISGEFVGSLGVTLTKNAQNNPYTPYKQFLEFVVIPNSVIFGNLIIWGEFLVAVTLIGASFYLLLKNPKEKLALITLFLGLIGGIFLNINFWFAFSWTSASADSLNLLMILIQAIGVYTLAKTIRD